MNEPNPPSASNAPSATNPHHSHPTSPSPSRSPQHIGFVHLVPFDRTNPRQGHLDGIELFRLAEQLGLDSGWVRTRHMQHGLSSPAVYFGALAQHTRRIGLGTAVIPVGFENPFRLAEDLATADLLAEGRLQLGLSVGPPAYADELNDIVYGTGRREQRFDYERVARLRELLAGRAIREVPEYEGIGGDFDSDRVEPFSPGLANRLWYGGGSLRSAEWAGRAGVNWLVSNISTVPAGVAAGGPTGGTPGAGLNAAPSNFAAVQRAQIDAYRAALAGGAVAAPAATPDVTADLGGSARSEGRVAVARVIVPLDGASAEQQQRYRAYVDARTPRTTKVHRRNTIVAPDLIGSAEEIVAAIRGDAAFQAADDYLFELPFEFGPADWAQIVEVIATRIGPALGWSPAAP